MSSVEVNVGMRQCFVHSRGDRRVEIGFGRVEVGGPAKGKALVYLVDLCMDGHWPSDVS